MVSSEKRRLLKIAQEEKILRLQAGIKFLRAHVRGYEARDGYNLREVGNLTRSQRRGVLRKFARLKALSEQPFTRVVTAHDVNERRQLRHYTGQRFRGQKNFFVHGPGPDARVDFRAGRLRVTSRFPGEIRSEEIFIPLKRARKWPADPEAAHEILLAQLRSAIRDLPAGGIFEVVTDSHGGIGDLADKGQIADKLNTYLFTYDDARDGTARFLNRVIGVRWFRTVQRGREVKRERDDARDRMHQLNANKRRKLRNRARKRIR